MLHKSITTDFLFNQRSDLVLFAESSDLVLFAESYLIGTHSLEACFSMKLMISSADCPPSYVIGYALLFPGQSIIVGYPSITRSLISFSVLSHAAITTLGLA